MRTTLPLDSRGIENHADSGGQIRTPRVSVVIPVYNARRTLERLCTQLTEELSDSWNLHFVLVDDGSSDDSATICRELHARQPDAFTCVLLSRNFGEHNAVMAGVNHADGDYCVVMDDDFQNPTKEVDRMLREIQKGFDVVYARYPQKCHSFWRNLGSRLHNAMAVHALGKPPGLYLSSFKVLSRFLVREVIKYRGPDPYLDAIILRATANIGVLTVSHAPREGGQSGYTVPKLFALWGNMIVAFSVYPLRLIGLYGLLTALAGLAYSSYKFLEWVNPGLPNPDRWETLNASIWFFRGSTLIVLCILGEYVGRIHRHLNNAPQYVIRSLLRSKEPPAQTGNSPIP